MANTFGQFESSDNQGSTEAFSGTATTTPANVPAVAGNKISGFLFTVDGNNVEISVDGGTTFWQVPKKATGYKDVKGEPTQLQIRTSSGNTDYSLWIDFEEN